LVTVIITSHHALREVLAPRESPPTWSLQEPCPLNATTRFVSCVNPHGHKASRSFRSRTRHLPRSRPPRTPRIFFPIRLQRLLSVLELTPFQFDLQLTSPVAMRWCQMYPSTGPCRVKFRSVRGHIHPGCSVPFYSDLVHNRTRFPRECELF